MYAHGRNAKIRTSFHPIRLLLGSPPKEIITDEVTGFDYKDVIHNHATL